MDIPSKMWGKGMGGENMKWYLIFYYDFETVVHEFNTKEEALRDYERYLHTGKVVLSQGYELNNTSITYN